MELTNEKAGFIKRLISTFLDEFALVGYVIYLPLSFFTPIEPCNGLGPCEIVGLIPFILGLLGFLPASILYYTLFWHLGKGRTLGNIITGIRVIQKNNREMEISDSFVRAISYLISFLPLGLGFLWIIWDPNKQGWHDKLANTLVVKDPPENKIKLLAIPFLIFPIILLLIDIARANNFFAGLFIFN